MSKHANFIAADDDKVSTINGRLPIIVADGDGDAYIHFLALAPPGMGLPQANEVIEELLGEVKAASDEWNYTDLEEALKVRGFETYNVAVFEGD